MESRKMSVHLLILAGFLVTSSLRSAEEEVGHLGEQHDGAGEEGGQGQYEGYAPSSSNDSSDYQGQGEQDVKPPTPAEISQFGDWQDALLLYDKYTKDPKGGQMVKRLRQGLMGKGFAKKWNRTASGRQVFDPADVVQKIKEHTDMTITGFIEAAGTIKEAEAGVTRAVEGRAGNAWTPEKELGFVKNILKVLKIVDRDYAAEYVTEIIQPLQEHLGVRVESQAALLEDPFAPVEQDARHEAAHDDRGGAALDAIEEEVDALEADIDAQAGQADDTDAAMREAARKIASGTWIEALEEYVAFAGLVETIAGLGDTLKDEVIPGLAGKGNSAFKRTRNEANDIYPIDLTAEFIGQMARADLRTPPTVNSTEAIEQFIAIYKNVDGLKQALRFAQVKDQANLTALEARIASGVALVTSLSKKDGKKLTEFVASAEYKAMIAAKQQTFAAAAPAVVVAPPAPAPVPAPAAQGLTVASRALLARAAQAITKGSAKEALTSYMALLNAQAGDLFLANIIKDQVTSGLSGVSAVTTYKRVADAAKNIYPIDTARLLTGIPNTTFYAASMETANKIAMFLGMYFVGADKLKELIQVKIQQGQVTSDFINQKVTAGIALVRTIDPLVANALQGFVDSDDYRTLIAAPAQIVVAPPVPAPADDEDDRHNGFADTDDDDEVVHNPSAAAPAVVVDDLAVHLSKRGDLLTRALQNVAEMVNNGKWPQALEAYDAVASSKGLDRKVHDEIIAGFNGKGLRYKRVEDADNDVYPFDVEVVVKKIQAMYKGQSLSNAITQFITRYTDLTLEQTVKDAIWATSSDDVAAKPLNDANLLLAIKIIGFMDVPFSKKLKSIYDRLQVQVRDRIAAFKVDLPADKVKIFTEGTWQVALTNYYNLQRGTEGYKPYKGLAPEVRDGLMGNGRYKRDVSKGLIDMTKMDAIISLDGLTIGDTFDFVTIFEKAATLGQKVEDLETHLRDEAALGNKPLLAALLQIGLAIDVITPFDPNYAATVQTIKANLLKTVRLNELNTYAVAQLGAPLGAPLVADLMKHFPAPVAPVVKPVVVAQAGPIAPIAFTPNDKLNLPKELVDTFKTGNWKDVLQEYNDIQVATNGYFTLPKTKKYFKYQDLLPEIRASVAGQDGKYKRTVEPKFDVVAVKTQILAMGNGMTVSNFINTYGKDAQCASEVNWAIGNQDDERRDRREQEDLLNKKLVELEKAIAIIQPLDQTCATQLTKIQGTLKAAIARL